MTLRFDFFYENADKEYFLALLQKLAIACNIDLRAESSAEFVSIFASAESSEILGKFADILQAEVPHSLYFKLKEVNLCNEARGEKIALNARSDIFSVSDINAIQDITNPRFCEIDSANNDNPRVSANLETRPLRGAKNRNQGRSSASADFLLEAEKRGSPPKSEKRQLLARRGSVVGGAALLREESSENNGERIAESIKESQGGLPRRFCESARNDEFLDYSVVLLPHNDNFNVDSATRAQNTESALDSAIKKYRTYGRNLGIAFQIIDDLLDITQEDSTLGKESFSDFKEGKTTLPYIYLYNALNQGDRAILKSYFKKPLNSVQKGWIRAKMSEFGIIEQVKNVARNYGEKALSALDSSDSSDKNLVKIITDMIDREF